MGWGCTVPLTFCLTLPDWVCKKCCLKYTTRGWDCASWCRFWHVPGCEVLLWVTASWVCASQSTTTGPTALCRFSTRIKVSIPSMEAWQIPHSNITWGKTPLTNSHLLPDNVLSLQPCICLSRMALREETLRSALTPRGAEPPFPQQSENERHTRT